MEKQHNDGFHTRINLYRDKLTVSYGGHASQPPPVPEGERSTVGMSVKTARRVRRACRYISSLGQNYFYTLTYPFEVDHKESKKHLSRFLKRMKRKGLENYVWVAEIQPKRYRLKGERVIHYHLLTEKRLDVTQVRKDWTDTFNTKLDAVLLSTNPFRVHALKVNNAAAYMSKVADYLTKDNEERPLEEFQRIEGNRAGLSHTVSAALKPLNGGIIKELLDWSDVSEIQLEKGLTWFSTDNYLSVFWGFEKYDLYCRPRLGNNVITKQIE